MTFSLQRIFLVSMSLVLSLVVSDFSLNNILGCFVVEMSGVVSSMESSESLSPVSVKLDSLDKLVLSARGFETVSVVPMAAFTIWFSVLISWKWFVLGLSCDSCRQS